MIDASDRHGLLLADRTRNADTIAAVIDSVLSEYPSVTLLDVETVFRDGAARAYIIAGNPFSIVFGMGAWRAALGDLGIDAAENRARLGTIPTRK